MTRRILNSMLAGLVGSAVGAVALAIPAAAGGWLAIDYAPSDPDEAQALQAGLGLVALLNGMENGESIEQLGMNNFAGIGQNGSGNNGIIQQYGDGHSASLQQNGNNNSYGIFQFGEATSADVVQNGNGESGASFVFGW